MVVKISKKNLFLKSVLAASITAGLAATNTVQRTQLVSPEEAFVDHNEAKNETVINVFEGGAMFDYYNDSYVGSEQIAGVSEKTWTVKDGGYLTVTKSSGAVSSMRVFDSGLNLYSVSDSGVDALSSLTKMQKIVDETFLGTYNVNIPTENTANNELVISNSSNCSYSGKACTWSLDASGKATLNFGAEETATARIWQVAGESDKYAFLITHSNNTNDIEVGFMTRK